MATAPNTVGIMNAIVGYLNSAQINSIPAYKTVTTGPIKDFADAVPCAMVFLQADGSDYESLGGKVWNKQSFHIISVVDYTQAQDAELLIANIRDAIIPIFQSRVRLGETGTVFESCVKPNSMAFTFIKDADGISWRSHEFDLEVTSEYFVPVGPGTA